MFTRYRLERLEGRGMAAALRKTAWDVAIFQERVEVDIDRGR
jgi:hypothetical protein